MHLPAYQQRRLSTLVVTPTFTRRFLVSASRRAADPEDPLVAPLQPEPEATQQPSSPQTPTAAVPSVTSGWAPYSPAPPRRDLPAALPQPTPRQLRAQQAEAARQEKAAHKAEQKRLWRLARRQKRDAQAARTAAAARRAFAPAGPSAASPGDLTLSPTPVLGVEPGYITTATVPAGLLGVEGQQQAEGSAWGAPPPAPHDPLQLLEVLQSITSPRRRLVIFKGGGYIAADLDALLTTHRLDHIMRVTNLIRKAHCVLAKPAWDNGKRVQLQEHTAAARKRRVPFLLVQKLQIEELLVVVRPLLIAKGVVRGMPGEERLSVPKLAEAQWGPQPAKPPRQRPTRQAWELQQELAELASDVSG